MRRPAKAHPGKLSSDSQKLVSLSIASTESSSCMEDRYWEQSLDTLIEKLLRSKQQETIDAAANYLFNEQPDGYDILADALEDQSESCLIEHDGQTWEVMLVVAPVLAWTRFVIPSGPLSSSLHASLENVFRDYFTQESRLYLSPVLYAIEQLPQDHCEVFALTHKLGLNALRQTPVTHSKDMPATIPFLADTRYLIAAAAVPAGQALFCWQNNPAAQLREAKAHAISKWSEATRSLLAGFLPGCNIAPLPPDAYFFSCRQADKQIRPASIKAAVHFLTQSMDISAEQIVVSIGRFGQELTGRIDEFRLGFIFDDVENVIYGTIWPLYEQESGDAHDNTSGAAEELPPLEHIMQLLASSGIEHIKLHDDIFNNEFCEDCGSPLYPNLEGELVHVQMPEDMVTGSGQQLH